jgi:hypothetical protein
LDKLQLPEGFIIGKLTIDLPFLTAELVERMPKLIRAAFMELVLHVIPMLPMMPKGQNTVSH